MTNFRKVHPKRGDGAESPSKYQDHRKHLREDFNCRCGYCDEPDAKRNAHFHIDHFVPQKILETISPTEYSNLVYACSYCNIAKSCKWPTNDEQTSNDGKQGFVDPCTEEYLEHLGRHNNGYIYPKTKLGEYIYHQLKLYLSRHAFIWQTDNIELKLEELEVILDQLDSGHPLFERITRVMLRFNRLRRRFERAQ